MKVITAFLLILVPGNYAKPLRISLQSFHTPVDYQDSVGAKFLQPIAPLSERGADQNDLFTLDDLIEKMPPALQNSYLIKHSLEDMSRNYVGYENFRFQKRAFSKKDKRYVNSNKRILQNTGRPNDEIRNLTLCHFKICNMGKRTSQYLHVVKEDKEK